MDERHLAGVARPAEHALPEEGAAEGDPVEAADQFALVPALDRVAVAHLVQPRIEPHDLVVDPGVVPVRAGIGATADHRLEVVVAAYLERPATDRAPESPRHMEGFQRHDSAPLGVDPVDGRGVAAL